MHIHVGSSKSNYHTITTTTAPITIRKKNLTGDHVLATL